MSVHKLVDTALGGYYIIFCHTIHDGTDDTYTHNMVHYYFQFNHKQFSFTIIHGLFKYVMFTGFFE